MAQSNRSVLLDALARGYRRFRNRLDRTLGSRDLATEALHETWLDLHKGAEPESVHNADGYVYIAALRTARRIRKVEDNRLDRFEARSLLELIDDAPGPERIALARNELAHLHRILDSLTRRQRIIFVEFYLGDTSKEALAERFGVHERTIRNELREALTKIARRMIDKDRFQDSAAPAPFKSGESNLS